MSKIGKKPIIVPENVAIGVNEKMINVKGPLGEINVPILDYISVIKDGSSLSFAITNERKQARSNWGTIRSLVMNAVLGVSVGFFKKLILEGVGFRVVKEGNDLNLSLGFSHPVKFIAPSGIVFEVEKNSILTIKGIDKSLVGEIAAKIRALKKPEPYKGKGFRYEKEVIRRKAGKKAASSS